MNARLMPLIKLSVFLIVAAFIAGCADKETTAAKPKETKTAAVMTAELKVDKAGAKPNDTLKYTFVLTNNSDKPMSDLTIKFVAPNGLGSGMAQSGGSKPAFDEPTNTWAWSGITVGAKGSYWFSIDMQVTPDSPAGVSISANYTAEGGTLSAPLTSNTAATKVE